MLSAKYNISDTPKQFHQEMAAHGMLHHAKGGTTLAVRDFDNDRACKTAQGKSVSACEVISYLGAAAVLGGAVGGIVTYATGSHGWGALAGCAVVVVVGVISYFISANHVDTSENEANNSKPLQSQAQALIDMESGHKDNNQTSIKLQATPANGANDTASLQ